MKTVNVQKWLKEGSEAGNIHHQPPKVTDLHVSIQFSFNL